MKSLIKISIIIPTLFFFNVATANVPDTRIETMPLIDVEVTENSSGDIEAVTQYPNGCFQEWSKVKKSKDNVLVLVHFAKIYENRFCTQALQFNTIEFNTDSLEGNYRVIDGHDGEVLGELEAQEDGAVFYPSSRQ